MARSYRPVDRSQEFLLPPSMTDWLGEDHLVWFVIEAVGRLDTAAFHSRARLGGVGRCGYDPEMILTLLVYAMAHGESSSRQIERLCHSDVAFRIICASDVPDHTVLARFRQRHEEALRDLLTASLVLAAELGMVSLGVVAFDGTKVAANASKQANRSEEHLRRLAGQFVDTVAATDAAEDDLFGDDSRGDEMPADVRDRSRRGQRITQALDQIAARRRAAAQASEERRGRARDYEQGAGDPDTPPKGRPPADADPVAVAAAGLERERVRARAAYERARRRRDGDSDGAAGEGSRRPRRRGRRPVPPEQRATVRHARARYEDAKANAAAQPGQPGPGDDAAQKAGPGGDNRFRANLSDPDSRLLKTRNGYIQGYNCQTSSSDDGFILTGRATQDANDVAQFTPTVEALDKVTGELSARTGRTDLIIGVAVGDSGYDSETNLTAPGPDRLIADSTRQAIEDRAKSEPATGDPPAEATTRQKMSHRLRTIEGAALYKRRAPLIEAPNAWLKDRRRLRRFSCRGLNAADAEFAFACAVTNLAKIATNGITATHLRTD